MATQPVDPELVDVFDSADETEVLVVKGLLDSAGIESVIVSIDATQDMFPGVGGQVIRVAREAAADAEQIIEEYRNNPPTEQEMLDADPTEGGQ